MSRIAIWLVATLGFGVATFAALPAGMKDVINGYTVQAQQPVSVSIDGVDEIGVSYEAGVDEDVNQPGINRRFGLLIIGFTASSEDAPITTLSPRLGQCEDETGPVPIGERAELWVNRLEGRPEGTLTCHVPFAYWTSLSTTTIVTPSVSGSSTGGGMREVSANIQVFHPKSASVRVQPDESLVGGFDRLIWTAIDRCDRPTPDTGGAELLTCYSRRGYVASTITIIDDPDAQSLATGLVFLAGILASACAASLVAAVQELTRHDQTKEDVPPPEAALLAPHPTAARDVDHDPAPDVESRSAKKARRPRATIIARRARNGRPGRNRRLKASPRT